MSIDTDRASAARAAIDEVKDGMMVGLGTGRTASYAVEHLAARIRAGLRVECVATSTATERLAGSFGIAITPFDTVARVDLTIDGADEIDAELRAIKGGGGALLREKIVAAASDRVIVVVDAHKVVARLGAFPLPIEVLPFARAWVMRTLADLGATPIVRVGADGATYRTDQGNLVVDAAFTAIADAPSLAARLSGVPGIVEHGLFVDEIDALFVGHPDRVEKRTRH